MLSKAPARQPPAVYRTRPILTKVLMVKKRQSLLKKRFVIAMNIAGMLMIICTSPGDAVWKCIWMMFRAGATAAPAITVRSDKDNIAVINLQRLCFLKMLYMSDSILLKKKSASPFGLTLSQLNAVRLPQKTEKSQWHFSAKRYATLCQNCISLMANTHNNDKCEVIVRFCIPPP